MVLAHAFTLRVLKIYDNASFLFFDWQARTKTLKSPHPNTEIKGGESHAGRGTHRD